MMIKKEQRDINLYTALVERENPGQTKAKQSSNMVLLVSAGFIIVMGAWWVMLNTQIGQINTKIEDVNDQILDVTNQETYKIQAALKKKVDEITAYNKASELFIGQLTKNIRFEKKWVDEYIKLIADEGQEESFLIEFDFKENKTITLKCGTFDFAGFSRFSEYLHTAKDEQGRALYHDVKEGKVTSVIYDIDGTERTVWEYTVSFNLWYTTEETEVPLPTAVPPETTKK